MSQRSSGTQDPANDHSQSQSQHSQHSQSHQTQSQPSSAATQSQTPQTPTRRGTNYLIHPTMLNNVATGIESISDGKQAYIGRLTAAVVSGLVASTATINVERVLKRAEALRKRREQFQTKENSSVIIQADVQEAARQLESEGLIHPKRNGSRLSGAQAFGNMPGFE